VSSTRREREQARKRHEKWEARQAVKAGRRRKRNLFGGIAAAVAVLVGVVLVVALPDWGATEPPAVEEAAELATDGLEATDAAQDPAATEDPASEDAGTESGRSLPDASLAQAREWQGSISTNEGELQITLNGIDAPQAVANFGYLATDGFFDSTPCHRLTTEGIFVLQCGDPEGTGMGGPGYEWGPIENAPVDGVYPAGTIAMARASAPDSMGSQFFIVYEDTTLPTDGGGYTVFGQVTGGLDVVKKIAETGVVDGASDGAPASAVFIEGVTIQ
jgi:peptidyl-prolyl cis-trans isomerase B (cyclophilin B)